MDLAFLNGFSDELQKIAFVASPSALAKNVASVASAGPPKISVKNIVGKTTATGAVVNPGNAISQSGLSNATQQAPKPPAPALGNHSKGNAPPSVN